MKITIKREMTIPQLRQCLYEHLLSIEEQFAVRYARNTTIYLSFTNGFGNEVRCVDPMGEDVNEIRSDGPYPCAAEKFDRSWGEYDYE